VQRFGGWGVNHRGMEDRQDLDDAGAPPCDVDSDTCDPTTGDDHPQGWAPGMRWVGGHPQFKAWSIGLFGCGIGSLAAWRTGLFAAVPVAVGLTALAVSDAESRRLPRRTFNRTIQATLVAGAIDVARSGHGRDAVMALVLAELVAVTALALWAITGGIAFGDVKLIGLAALIPAWRSPQQIGTLLVVAIIASLGVVIVRWWRQGYAEPGGTIAFGPPVLIGWIVASAVAG
jgi:hypothetical protein